MHDVILVDSITSLAERAADGVVVVTGSHGGRLTASFALRAGARGLVVHDAAIGRDAAGIEALELFAERGLACVSVEGARIGDAGDVLRRGRLSRVNSLAAELGLRADDPARVAAQRIADASSTPAPALPQIALRAPRLLDGPPGARPLWLFDTASAIAPEQAGAVVVTGSHANLIGGRPESAASAEVFAIVFNDAGDPQGDRLGVLDTREIAAVAVTAMSARIGDAASTLADGVISLTNDTARRLGAAPGQPAAAWVERARAAR